MTFTRTEHYSQSEEESHEELARSTPLPGDLRGGQRRAGGDVDHGGRPRTSRPCWAASRFAASRSRAGRRFDQRDEKNLLDVLHSGKWFRGGGECVNRFEAAYAEPDRREALRGHRQRHERPVRLAGGARHRAGRRGDRPSLHLHRHDQRRAAPVRPAGLRRHRPGDASRSTPRKIEAAITDRTAAIMPVHLGGNVADMDAILAIARKHKLPVIEDACQAHLAEWRGKKVGTLGTTGCFSFQVTKNLCSGEGGAILTNDGELAEQCYAFQNNNRGRTATGYNFAYLGGRGANLRMTEFQGNLLLAQMTRLEEQSRTREQNAQYLTSMLKEIPGILPAKMYEGCTRNAYHLYMFRYKSEAFGGLPRAKFLQALEAEGIPCSAGYSPLNKESFLPTALELQGIPAALSQGGSRPLGGAEPLPGQRPALPGGRLVHPDHVPGHPQRHGPDRRGRAEDPGPRGGAGAGS